MSGPAREYRVDHFRNHEHETESTLADVSAATPTTAPAAPVAPEGNQAMQALLTRKQEGIDPDRDSDEAVDLDQELLERARGSLQMGLLDWAVTDADAHNTLSVLQEAKPEQQALLVQALRESGDLETLIEQLPAEDLAALDGTLGAYLTSDRIAEAMEGMWVTDESAGAAVDLLTKLTPEQQAASLLELGDADFERFVAELPADRRTDLADAFGSMADPRRRLLLWGAVHGGQAQEQHDAGMEEAPGFWDRSEDANLVRHRNDQRDAILSSRNTEIEEEIGHLLPLIESGSADLDDVLALQSRKGQEAHLENTYGVNLTNDTGRDGLLYDVDRRVWTEAELAALDGAFSRMPTEHVRDNTALTEIRRLDVRRDGLWGKEKPNVGADAGSGLVRFYDTGTDYRNGVNGPGNPWRTESESDLSGHDAAQTGSNGETHLIQEVLSHELGHTVHQGDRDLESDFHALSGWDHLKEGEVRDRLVASGMSREDADARIEQLESTRDDGYNVRDQIVVDGELVQVDPYSGRFLTVNAEAIPDRAEDPGGDWGYAESNPSDHFAELYTKAVHAPESLHHDLIEEPTAEVTRRETDLAALEASLEAQRETLPEADLELMERTLATQREELEAAREAQRLRAEQHGFMRERVFQVDDSDIQALTAPPGKEAIYAQYQAEAAMCMTPLQLDALRARYADQL